MRRHSLRARWPKGEHVARRPGRRSFCHPVHRLWPEHPRHCLPRHRARAG
jgi:hypothetical protein